MESEVIFSQGKTLAKVNPYRYILNAAAEAFERGRKQSVSNIPISMLMGRFNSNKTQNMFQMTDHENLQALPIFCWCWCTH